MHAGAVRVNGEKMSKSLGNFFTIREVLEKYHPEVVRYLLIASHYRSPINYSEENLRESKRALERFYHRSEEHTSELQSLMRISYAVFCLKKKKTHQHFTTQEQNNHI